MAICLIFFVLIWIKQVYCFLVTGSSFAPTLSKAKRCAVDLRSFLSFFAPPEWTMQLPYIELFERYEYKLRIRKDIFSKKKPLSQKMICFLKKYEIAQYYRRTKKESHRSMEFKKYLQVCRPFKMDRSRLTSSSKATYCRLKGLREGIKMFLDSWTGDVCWHRRQARHLKSCVFLQSLICSYQISNRLINLDNLTLQYSR